MMRVLLLYIHKIKSSVQQQMNRAKSFWREAHKLSGLLTLGILMSACQSSAPPALENPDWVQLRTQLQSLDDWALRGRVNVRYYDESHTPRIQWQQSGEQYHIRLWGTFNAGNTEIDGGPGLVTLEQDGEVLTASSPEDLILQQLGYELPVSHLEHWIKGVPSPVSDAQLNFNELNQLSSLNQDGWSVIYTDMRQYQQLALPRRVDVSRQEGDVRLRFIGLDWTLKSDLEGGAEDNN